MPARRLLPWLLLGLLSVLAVGALVLGLVEAPAAADLAVHNATGETLSASSFSADISALAGPAGAPAAARFLGRIDYTAPDTVRVSHIAGRTTGPAAITLTGPRARNYLGPLTALRRFSDFRRVGATFTASLPVARFVPPLEARLVHGTYRVAITVGGNRVTAVTEQVLLITPSGTTRQTVRYVFLEIGGEPVVQPAS